MRKLTIILFTLIVSTFFPLFTYASYFTLPVDIDPANDVSAWFDHNSSGGSFLRHDGDTTDNYDGHQGTDFASSTIMGADVLAPADGEVKEVYWDNCGGWQMHIWHEDIGLSTLYSHLGTTTSATTTDLVSQGEHIADVDITGSCTTGAHLHFGVADGEDRGISNRIDPFGWTGGGSDPWIYDLGYLWSSNLSLVWSDGFEGYTTGNLGTQGGWSAADADLDVSATSPYAGTRNITNGGSNVTGINAYVVATSSLNVENGLRYVFSVAHKSNDSALAAANNPILVIGNSPTGTIQEVCVISRAGLAVGGGLDDNDIYLTDTDNTNSEGAAPVQVENYSVWTPTVNTWRIYELEFDFSANSCRARIDGGTWSAVVNPQRSIASTTRAISVVGTTDNDNAYWDNFYIYAGW